MDEARRERLSEWFALIEVPEADRRYTRDGHRIREYRNGDPVVLRFSKYVENDRVALELMLTDGEDVTEPYMRVSVNLTSWSWKSPGGSGTGESPEAVQALLDDPDAVIAVKDWSENYGVRTWLINQGIIDPDPICAVSVGHVEEVFLHELLVREDERKPEGEPCQTTKS